MLVAEACRRKRVADLRADLVTARTDRRADRRNEIPRVGAERAAQTLDDDARYTLRETAPPCVCRRNRSRSTIGDEQRDTVRSLHRKHALGPATDDDVADRRTGLSDASVGENRVMTVHLPEPHER